MGGHAPHVGVDGHAVVVEDHHHRLPGGPGVVEPLVGQTAGQRAVPDEGGHAVVLPGESPGPGHAQGHGHGVGGVSGDEGVVDALLRLRKAGEPSQLTQGAKELPAAGEGFVDVALVAHIKHQPVGSGVKHPVDGHRQLHRPQVRSQMPPGLGDAFDKKLPQLLTELGELSVRQRSDIGWGMDGF